MKTIFLTQGKETLVSNCDYHYLMQWKWCFHKASKANGGIGGYAKRAIRKPTYRTIFMYTVVAARMGIEGRPDHKDQNKLNNRRCNLRPATGSQNKINCGKRRDNKSGYKGVCWYKRLAKWQAAIGVKGVTHYLKLWDSKEAAARAYNHAAKKHFGKFAVLNKVP